MIDPPLTIGYSIYSRSGCCNCDKAKKKIEATSHPLLVINCDEDLIEDRQSCLLNLKLYTGQEFTQFPLIFYNGDYIGSWKDLSHHLEWNSSCPPFSLYSGIPNRYQK